MAIASAGKPKTVLLLAGPPSHSHGAHEHLPGMRILEKCLKDVPSLNVKMIDVSGDWREGPKLIRQADGIVMYLDYGSRWEQENPERKAALEDLRRRGRLPSLGARRPRSQVYSFSYSARRRVPGGPDRKYTHADVKLHAAADEHPITSGIDDFQLNDDHRTASQYRAEILRHFVVKGQARRAARRLLSPISRRRGSRASVPDDSGAC